MSINNTKTVLGLAGVSSKDLETKLDSFRLDQIKGHWSFAFRGPKDVQEVGRMAYNKFLSDNGIVSLRVPYFGDLESELLEICTSLFNPTPDSCANLTSGGSESIYSAIHAMREWAKEKYPHIKEPELIAPYSAHPTFSKGCHYFGLKLIRTSLDENRRASLDAMKSAITENTIGLVGSAPCWPYGLYDPIGEIGALAKENGFWMHTDACVGGYLAPFVEKLGYKIPAWDFRVPGVMSISADLHKYGYCHKSASTVLWRNRELQQYHYVHPSDWPAGEYATTGFAGSRSGGPVFAAWAVMNYLGEEGYVKLAQQVMDTKKAMMEGINAIEGLKAWDNDLFPMAFESNKADLENIVGAMKQKGWFLLGCKEPPLVNLPIDPAVTDEVKETFLSELREVTEAILAGEALEKGDLAY